MSEGEFSVCRFFENGTYEYVCRFRSAEEAVTTAKRVCEEPAALLGIVKRVIITDALDFTNFEWKFGEGVVFPPRDGAGDAQ